MAGLARKIRRFILFRVLHADDTPHAISLGMALGMLVAMTPTIGFQMIIALGLATLCRANKVVSIAMVWISNPVTMFYIFYQNWRIGKYVVGTSHFKHESAVRAQLQEISESIGGFSNVLMHLFDGEFWSRVVTLMWDLGVELWIGSFIVGIALSIPTYALGRWAIVFYRRKIPKPHFLIRLKNRQQNAANRLTATPQPRSNDPRNPQPCDEQH